jgi:hypothetical protein
VPLTEVVNPNIAMVTSFSVHDDAAEAEARGRQGFQFFNYALAHYYIYGSHVPGHTDIWKKFAEVDFDIMISQGAYGGIGTPETVTKHCKLFEDAGVDQVVFVQQGGRNRHEHIVEALELFADCVMPQFKTRHAAREARKMEELAPYIERAFQRKRAAEPPRPPAEPPAVPSYGKSVAQGGPGIGTENKIF